MFATAPELSIALLVILAAFALLGGVWLFDWMFPQRRVDPPFSRDDDWGRH